MPLAFSSMRRLALADLLGHAVEDGTVDARRRHEGLARGLGLRLGGLQLLGALGGLAYHDFLEPRRVGLRTTGDELTEGDLLQVVVRAERRHLAVEVALLLARTHEEVHADRALQRFGGLGQLDRVHGPAVAGDVAGTQAELVGELHQRVLDLGVALFRLHRVHRLGVGGLAQLGEERLLRLEQLEATVQARLLRHVLHGGVELLRRAVRGGADLLHLGSGALVGQQRLSGEVTLVQQGLPVLGGRADDQGRVLRVLRLVPGVDRPLHLEAAHDQADERGDQENRVQPGRHPPVPRGQPTGAAACRFRLGRRVRRRGQRGARRRREVAPLRLPRGALVASPHSTNNLSASAPTLCRIIVQGLYYWVVRGIAARGPVAFQTVGMRDSGCDLPQIKRA